MPNLSLIVAVGQGLFFLLGGMWPVVHIRSFMAVTGPKTDLWQVKTAGLLVAVIGVVLLAAAWNGRVTPEVALLGAGSAAALAVIDFYYVGRGVISRTYLLDAAAQVAIIVAWATAWLAR